MDNEHATFSSDQTACFFLFGDCLSAILAAGMAFCHNRPERSETVKLHSNGGRRFGMVRLELEVQLEVFRGKWWVAKNIQVNSGPTRPPLEHE